MANNETRPSEQVGLKYEPKSILVGIQIRNSSLRKIIEKSIDPEKRPTADDLKELLKTISSATEYIRKKPRYKDEWTKATTELEKNINVLVDKMRVQKPDLKLIANEMIYLAYILATQAGHDHQVINTILKCIRELAEMIPNITPLPEDSKVASPVAQKSKKSGSFFNICSNKGGRKSRKTLKKR